MHSVYTVGQVNNYIKNMFTQDYMLNRIYVKGEVSNCKYHTSGHIYFSLKDESGTISCIMFAGARAGLSFRMQEGQSVIVLGAVKVFERDGKYQLYAKEIILDGVGRLYEKYEQLKQELEEMGMFAREYKQPIPLYAKTVGIVTAPTGAAVRDIIQISKRRNPYVRLILYPALVQGEGAADSIVNGIRMMDNLRPDVLIIGRGGGSIEDLWAFNEEKVARAIFECSVPTISAVGHETDTVISDFVADLRAPTPSAAAELAVSDMQSVDIRLQDIRMQIKKLCLQNIQNQRIKIEQLSVRLKYMHPGNQLDEQRMKTASYEEILRRMMQECIMRDRHKLAIYMEKMKGLSPIEKLNQGYSYVETSKGSTLKSTKQIKAGEDIHIFITDGRIDATVNNIVKETRDVRDE